MIKGIDVHRALYKLRQSVDKSTLEELQVPTIIKAIMNINEIKECDNVTFKTVTLYIDVNYSIVEKAMKVKIAKEAIENTLESLDLQLVRIESTNGTNLVVSPIIQFVEG